LFGLLPDSLASSKSFYRLNRDSDIEEIYSSLSESIESLKPKN